MAATTPRSPIAPLKPQIQNPNSNCNRSFSSLQPNKRRRNIHFYACSSSHDKTRAIDLQKLMQDSPYEFNTKDSPPSLPRASFFFLMDFLHLRMLISVDFEWLSSHCWFQGLWPQLNYRIWPRKALISASRIRFCFLLLKFSANSGAYGTTCCVDVVLDASWVVQWFDHRLC